MGGGLTTGGGAGGGSTGGGGASGDGATFGGGAGCEYRGGLGACRCTITVSVVGGGATGLTGGGGATEAHGDGGAGAVAVDVDTVPVVPAGVVATPGDRHVTIRPTAAIRAIDAAALKSTPGRRYHCSGGNASVALYSSCSKLTAGRAASCASGWS
jgi:hypothetical protein